MQSKSLFIWHPCFQASTRIFTKIAFQITVLVKALKRVMEIQNHMSWRWLCQILILQLPKTYFDIQICFEVWFSRIRDTSSMDSFLLSKFWKIIFLIHIQNERTRDPYEIIYWHWRHILSSGLEFHLYLFELCEIILISRDHNGSLLQEWCHGHLLTWTTYNFADFGPQHTIERFV